MNRKYFWVIPLLCVAMYALAFFAGRARRPIPNARPAVQTGPVGP